MLKIDIKEDLTAHVVLATAQHGRRQNGGLLNPRSSTRLAALEALACDLAPGRSAGAEHRPAEIARTDVVVGEPRRLTPPRFQVSLGTIEQVRLTVPIEIIEPVFSAARPGLAPRSHAEAA